WPWVASFAIFLAWVLGGIRSQPGFYHEVVVREFIGRFGETIHRPQPLLFYLPHLLHKFAPWSVLMIAIALVDLRSRNWRFHSLLQSFLQAATQVGRSSPAIAIIVTSSPPLDETFGAKRNHTTGVTRSCPPGTKAFCSTCKRSISSTRCLQSLNGATEISMRW